MPDWQDDDIDGLNDIETWMKQRAADVARLNDPGAELLGRNLWASTTQTDAPISAPTPSDVRTLGASQLDCGPQTATTLNAALERARAAGRGAEDAVLVGYGDNVEAGLRSIPSLFSGAPIGSSYEGFLRQAQDQDSYDQAHYPLSRALGEVAGTGLALIGTDGAAAALVPKLTTSAARAMPALTGVERGRLALGGAGAGVVGQGAFDTLTDHSSGWRDYVGAALGGATVAATGGRLRPVPTAALGGAVASATDGLLNNGQIDPTGVEHSMVAAGYLGGAGQAAGERGSNGLDFRDKGKLGESLSRMKAFAQDNHVTSSQVRQTLANGKTTILDHVLSFGPQDVLESKFGPKAVIRPNQKAFMAQSPDRMAVQYWMPAHVGKIAGGAFATLGLPGIDWADPNRQLTWP
jgi:hypothetical protein